MKKGMLFVGALVAFAFASCKKEYTCECKSTCGSSTSSVSYTFTAKKKDAKDACNTYAATSSGCTSSCELK